MFAILLTTFCIPSIYSQRVLEIYENEKYGIKIQYPPNWEASEFTNIAGETGEVVIEIHPFGKSEPFVSLFVNFLSPENTTLKSFTEQKLKFI
jgi:hypothetical protein